MCIIILNLFLYVSSETTIGILGCKLVFNAILLATLQKCLQCRIGVWIIETSK